MFMYLLETAIIMFLSFIRFELLSFEHGNTIRGLVKKKTEPYLIISKPHTVDKKCDYLL